MRIKPIAFNYGELLNDMPDTEVKIQRKNVVLDNKIVGMWGESIDPENQIMLLTSLSVKREHTKDTKETIIELWESTLSQYAVEEQPEEILARIQEKAEKEAERAKQAAETARKAEEKAQAAKASMESNKKEGKADKNGKEQAS